MRSFLILVATFVTVYFLAPWLALKVLDWLPNDNLEPLRPTISFFAIYLMYHYLRRRLGNEYPPV